MLDESFPLLWGETNESTEGNSFLPNTSERCFTGWKIIGRRSIFVFRALPELVLLVHCPSWFDRWRIWVSEKLKFWKSHFNDKHEVVSHNELVDGSLELRGSELLCQKCAKTFTEKTCDSHRVKVAGLDIRSSDSFWLFLVSHRSLLRKLVTFVLLACKHGLLDTWHYSQTN